MTKVRHREVTRLACARRLNQAVHFGAKSSSAVHIHVQHNALFFNFQPQISTADRTHAQLPSRQDVTTQSWRETELPTMARIVCEPVWFTSVLLRPAHSSEPASSPPRPSPPPGTVAESGLSHAQQRRPPRYRPPRPPAARAFSRSSSTAPSPHTPGRSPRHPWPRAPGAPGPAAPRAPARALSGASDHPGPADSGTPALCNTIFYYYC